MGQGSGVGLPVLMQYPSIASPGRAIPSCQVPCLGQRRHSRPSVCKQMPFLGRPVLRRGGAGATWEDGEHSSGSQLSLAISSQGAAAQQGS